MKSNKIFSLVIVCLALAGQTIAQSKTEQLNVSGNCGMCKKKIEKAAKDGGATAAVWNKDTKILDVTYNSQSTNSAKIQQAIAVVGYDTPTFTATDEAYNALDACCKYERKGKSQASHMAMAMHCGDKCGEQCKQKDGKCADMAACKEKGCCKDGNMAKADGMSCGDKCEKKDGKCTHMADSKTAHNAGMMMHSSETNMAKCTDMAACKDKASCKEAASMHKGMSCSDKCEKKDGKCADMAACKEKGCCKDGEACEKAACCKKSR